MAEWRNNRRQRISRVRRWPLGTAAGVRTIHPMCLIDSGRFRSQQIYSSSLFLYFLATYSKPYNLCFNFVPHPLSHIIVARSITGIYNSRAEIQYSNFPFVASFSMHSCSVVIYGERREYNQCDIIVAVWKWEGKRGSRERLVQPVRLVQFFSRATSCTQFSSLHWVSSLGPGLGYLPCGSYTLITELRSFICGLWRTQNDTCIPPIIQLHNTGTQKVQYFFVAMWKLEGTRTKAYITYSFYMRFLLVSTLCMPRQTMSGRHEVTFFFIRLEIVLNLSIFCGIL